MKNIAYIELDTHSEIASNFMELMTDSDQFKVDFYCSPKINRLVNHQSDSVIVTTPNSLLDEMAEKSYDLVIIGTVHRYFNVFRQITKAYPTAIIAHNLNFAHASRLDLLKSVFKKEFFYRLKLLVKEGLLSAPKLYRENRLLVLDKGFQSSGMTYLPLFYTQFSEIATSDFFKIVIPGAVSQSRRDYQHILNEVLNFKPEKPYQFVFLGKAQGDELKALKSNETKLPKQVSFKYYTEKVPQNLYDEEMKSANLLWCPIRKETEFFSIREEYGVTKMTGNIGDAIKYAKVAVFPKNYPSEYGFITQEKERFLDLVDVLSLNNFDFQNQFNKEKIKIELHRVLNLILN